MKDTGVYGQLIVAKRCASIISNIVCSYLDLQDKSKFVDPEKYHVTLLYSRKGSAIDIPALEHAQYQGVIDDLQVWDGYDHVFVATIDCPKLQERHRLLMNKYDLQWDYPSYCPHITLAYDISPGKKMLRTLKDILVGKQVHLVNESFTPLDEDHKDTE